jgi:hypothetical protein
VGEMAYIEVPFHKCPVLGGGVDAFTLVRRSDSDLKVG